MQLEEMGIEKLEKLVRELMAQRAEIKENQMRIQEVLDRKRAEWDAREKVAQMSDAEKMALFQVVKAEGIESGEVVKGLG